MQTQSLMSLCFAMQACRLEYKLASWPSQPLFTLNTLPCMSASCMTGQYSATVPCKRARCIASTLSAYLQLQGPAAWSGWRVQDGQGCAHLDGVAKRGACAVHLQGLDAARVHRVHS